MRPSVVILALLATASQANGDASAPAFRAQAAQIAGNILQGRGYELLTDLSENVGGRVTGTKAYGDAVAWAKRELTAAGAQDVHTEKAKLAATWERGTASGRVVGKNPRPLDVVSYGWAPSTPRGGVSGPVVVIESIDPAAWKPLASKLRGAVVVVVDRSASRDQVVWMLASLPLFAKAGALAVLNGGATLPNRVRSYKGLGDQIAPLPLATIGFEDASFLVRHARDGLRVELSLSNTVGRAAEVESVVGEIKGSEAGAGWLMVSAHLDSWDAATGTQDNGSGVVTVIETARALAAVGGLKRTVRFALWAGEEQFLVGARAYVAAHRSELDSCVAILNTDSGAGHVVGWRTDGRDDVRDAVMPITSTYLRGLGGDSVASQYVGGSDHEAFMLAGVPTLDLAVDETSYEVVQHMVADTLEKVNEHALKSGITVMATTAYVLAMSTQRLAPRLDHDGIERVLDRNGTADFLRAMNFWK